MLKRKTRDEEPTPLAKRPAEAPSFAKRKTDVKHSKRRVKIARLCALHKLTLPPTVLGVADFLDFDAMDALQKCSWEFRTAYHERLKWVNVTRPLFARVLPKIEPFARRIYAAVDASTTKLDLRRCEKLTSLTMTDQREVEIMPAPGLRFVRATAPRFAALPPLLESACITDASDALVEQLAKCQTLRSLTLLGRCDVGTRGVAPNLRELSVSARVPTSFKVPDSVVELDIACENVPTTLPSALRKLRLKLCAAQVPPVLTVPDGVTDFRLKRTCDEPLGLLLPMGLTKLTVRGLAALQSVPGSLGELEFGGFAHMLPTEPNNIHTLTIRFDAPRGQVRLDTALHDKCPSVQNLRLVVGRYTRNLPRYFRTLPLMHLEQLVIEFTAKCEAFSLDLSFAPSSTCVKWRGAESARLDVVHLQAQALHVSPRRADAVASLCDALAATCMFDDAQPFLK